MFYLFVVTQSVCLCMWLIDRYSSIIYTHTVLLWFVLLWLYNQLFVYVCDVFPIAFTVYPIIYTHIVLLWFVLMRLYNQLFVYACDVFPIAFTVYPIIYTHIVLLWFVLMRLYNQLFVDVCDVFTHSLHGVSHYIYTHSIAVICFVVVI